MPEYAPQCCSGCDMVQTASELGLSVVGHEDRGCALSAAQQVMLAERLEDQRALLAQEAARR